MARFTVNLEDDVKPTPQADSVKPVKVKAAKLPGAKSPWPRRLAIIGGSLAVILVIAGIGSYVYWRSLRTTPQYSLALLVDAAKAEDQKTIDTLVDFDAVVNDFVPQVTNKAVELYGKGLPPKVIGQLAQIAAPVMPAVKERAKAELPRVVRDRVAQFGNVPFFAMVLGASRYLDITVTGDTALIKSKLPEHPLELKMKRNGDRWQIAGVKDEKLATEIAQKIGQQLIAIAQKGGVKKAADTMGVGGLTDLLKKAEEITNGNGK